MFPFALGGIRKESLGLVRRLPNWLVSKHLSKSELRAFGDVYFDVLDAIADRDLDFLQ